MPGLLRGVARTAVIAGTATAVSNRVSRRQYGRWSQQAETEEYEQQQNAEPEPPAQDDTSARLEQLRQLGELKASGVLTEAEFQEQKARLLG